MTLDEFALKLVFPTVNHGHIGDLKLVHVHNDMHLGLLYGNGSSPRDSLWT